MSQPTHYVLIYLLNTMFVPTIILRNKAHILVVNYWAIYKKVGLSPERALLALLLLNFSRNIIS